MITVRCILCADAWQAVVADEVAREATINEHMRTGHNIDLTALRTPRAVAEAAADIVSRRLALSALDWLSSRLTLPAPTRAAPDRPRPRRSRGRRGSR